MNEIRPVLATSRIRTPVLAICAGGTRSLYATLLLKAQCYTNVKNVAGGMGAWVEAGLPTN